ncbi:sacsin N-terminal ATP-binding-like domain-containing protein [Nocardioides campestrisoli]|uniref:sacsin N-terminal ATP-binding-like domain-containing protein n=1 Tax=Nocardioides campestrisoli TaxID=2736757 RepID=UPI0015E63439|nr:hypothetical protein [Nocardioides campestrisoli]
MNGFETLTAMRRRAVDGLRENGMETGFRQLLADLYPDNAHFIYELLQNAEDAGAREVIFDLRPDGLRVEHDGARMFDLKDIESITSIGQSTKADDAVAIGKFGVGFKAVFAYTRRPVIHSGDHSFAIVDLFVPVPVDDDRQPKRTTFWFPFDRPDKPAQLASEQVERSLRDISQSTLLFLNHISMISCSFPDGDERLLERKQSPGSQNVISIESVHDGEEPSDWYRITGHASIQGQSYPVAAALALHTAESGERTVRPVEGQVFIYFPAVSETSGLKFHIHAPFASTVARDSVRDDRGNDELVAGIARVVAAELPRMRAAGLISDGLLEALPNNDDQLKPRYVPIHDAVVEAFATTPITPVAGGRDFAESRRLVRSVSQIRAALDLEDVRILRGITAGEADATGWLQEPRIKGRAQAFLASLPAIDFQRSDLAEVLERVRSLQEDVDLYDEDNGWELDDNDRADLDAWTGWLERLSDAKLRALYAALGRLAEEGAPNPFGPSDLRRLHWSDPLPEVLPAVNLLRVQAGHGVSHVVGRDAHLPASPGLAADGLVLDALAVFGQGETKAAEQEANALRQFYTNAGVKHWDAVAQLGAKFGSYRAGEEFDLADHVEDLKLLVKLLAEKAVAPAEYANRAILLGSTSGGGLQWVSPRSACLDEPYAATGLSALPGVVPLASEYLRYELDVTALASTLGARAGVEVMRASPKRNPEFSWSWAHNERDTVVSQDWVIADFDKIVASENEDLLRTLWRTVAATPEDRATASYRANRAQPWHSMRSQVVHQLTRTPWVLDRFGNLNLPQEIDPRDLDESLADLMGWGEDTPVEKVHVLLGAHKTLLGKVGFGTRLTRDAELAAVGKAERERADEAAKALGFEDAAEADRFKAAREKNPELYERLLAELDAPVPSLPEGASNAPVRRSEQAAEGARLAQSRAYEKRTRSVRIQEPGHLSAARNYLRQMYTNGQDVMVCQLCDSAMPFKVGDGYYFEAVQFVNDATKDLQENRLALCPVCAAKYRHARETKLEDLRDDLLTQLVDTRPSVEVAVTLAREDLAIRFVGKHAIDLQAVLEGTNDGPVEAIDAGND